VSADAASDRVPFSAIMQALSKSPDHTISVPDTSRQGRAMFGGLAAALCVQAAIDAIPDLPPLRSAQFLFVGPATEIVRISASLLRRGKSAVIGHAEMSDANGMLVHAHLCFGNARASAIDYDDLIAPDVKAPREYPLFAPPPRAGAPVFFQNFEMRIAGKSMPFSGTNEPDFLTWMRFRAEADRNADIPPSVALVGIGDAPPSSGVLMLKTPSPISTMTWSIDMLTDEIATDDGWWLIRNVAEQISGGYSSQAMTLWNRNGRPIMASRQNIAVFG